MAKNKSIKCPRCNTNPRGKYTYCNPCHVIKSAAWREANPDKAASIAERQQQKAREKRRKAKLAKQIIVPARLKQIYDVLTMVPTGECVIWDGCLSTTGYGQLAYKGRAYPAHRLVLELMLGRELQEGYETMHTCDVRDCIAPWHLREATHTENMRDAAQKGRLSMKRPWAWGGSVRLARRQYTPEQVREARALRNEGHKYSYITDKVGMSIGGLVKILYGLTYREIV